MNKSYATGYNTTCKIRATLIEGDWDDEHYTLMVIIKAILLVLMTAQINNHSEVMGAALDT
jgi:hypothetical protein